MLNFLGASMTLAGLVPPLCGDNGGMLVDGGYSKSVFMILQTI
jgi:predicted acylesterase/phospholipase RssA